MNCPKCGAENDDNAFRCMKCNEVLHRAPPGPEPPPKADPDQTF